MSRRARSGNRRKTRGQGRLHSVPVNETRQLEVFQVPEGVRLPMQQDLLGRPERKPKPRERECGPERTHDQRKKTMRGCLPENMHNRWPGLLHHTLPAYLSERNVLDDDTPRLTEMDKRHKPRTVSGIARRRTRKKRGLGGGAVLCCDVRSAGFRSATRPTGSRAGEREKHQTTIRLEQTGESFSSL